jgi:UDP-glucose 4-epimerase
VSRIHYVFGGAGFIGKNLIESLLEDENVQVICVDNLSRGRASFLSNFLSNKRFSFIQADIADYNYFEFDFDYFGSEVDQTTVWHLVANSDIAAGVSDIGVDLKDTFTSTVNILRWMKLRGYKEICFASSSAIYGDHGYESLHEEIGNCYPISNYGAMKLASEAIISAACEDFLHNANVYRFPNVVGTPATHGVIYDFVKKLKTDPRVLAVLGDGSQKKSYLHVSDLVDAMIYIAVTANHDQKFNVFNIGPLDEGIFVRDIAEIVANLYSPTPNIVFGSGNKGWVGDVPKFKYSIKKLENLGWQPSMGSRAAIELSAKQIYNQILAENE